MAKVFKNFTCEIVTVEYIIIPGSGLSAKTSGIFIKMRRKITKLSPKRLKNAGNGKNSVCGNLKNRGGEFFDD